MSNFEDRNRESLKRDDPKEGDKQGVPQREGGEPSNKYSREGQGKGIRGPDEESNPEGSPSGQGSGSHASRSSNTEDNS